MKRLTFLIATLCMLQMNVNAQTFENVASGKGCPRFYYIPGVPTTYSDGVSDLYSMERRGYGYYSFTFFDSDFSVCKQFDVLQNDSVTFYAAGFLDADCNTATYDGEMYDLLPLTKNTFNDDDKIEYIRAISAPDSYIPKRIEVVNEDNSVLFAIPAIANCDFYEFIIIEYRDKCFLAVMGFEDGKDASGYEIYAINKNENESSISKVKTLPGLSASPVLANRNSVVDVTIDEAAAANGGELVIVDNSGRIVAKQQFEPGQTTVPVQTDRMRTGVYNITFNNGEKIDNARIIVK